MLDILNFSTGKYHGEVLAQYNDPLLLSALENINQLVNSPNATVLASGRNRTVLVEVPFRNEKLKLVIKSFHREKLLRSLISKIHGTKAQRTWRIAIAMLERGVGTSPPVLYMERYMKGQILESYYASEYVPDTITFGHRLVELFQKEPEYRNFKHLLCCVAHAVRRMHDSGIYHGDMGNQNILVRTKGKCTPKDILFLDLNRSRIRSFISVSKRGRDISRLNLPRHFVRVFLRMYWEDVPPLSLYFFQQLHRVLYAVHCATRCIRHPVRWLTSPRHSGYAPIYPEWSDMWVWDEQTDLPVNIHVCSRIFSLSNHIKIIRNVMSTSPLISKQYADVLKQSYHAQVEICGRIGISLSPVATISEGHCTYIAECKQMPVMLRLSPHYTDSQMNLVKEIAKEMHKRNHPVSLRFVQSRFAVKNTQIWNTFILESLARTAEFADFVEIGCGSNRGEWGIWKIDEYLTMLKVIASVRKLYPHLKIAGPAIINFDSGFLLGVLKNMPNGTHFDILSHHLQFDDTIIIRNERKLVRKIASMKVIANSFSSDKLIISEIWYNPVTSATHNSAKTRTEISLPTEDVYSAFMIRYILTGLCSGFIHQIYCRMPVIFSDGNLQLAMNRSSLAYRSLSSLLNILGKTRFVEKLSLSSNVQMLVFQNEFGQKVCAIYTTHGVGNITFPFKIDAVKNFVGDSCDDCISGNQIRVTMVPIYIFFNERT